MSIPSNRYKRPQVAELERRLAEPRRFMQVVIGPRQVGKTTLVQQATSKFEGSVRFVSADEPGLQPTEWLSQQWEAARLSGGVLVIDEVQKVPNWSEAVKRLWDEDSRNGRDLKVVLLGSAPLLVQRGLTESLAGRFETLRIPHWSFSEMSQAFGFTLEQFLYFGGYPGAASLVNERERWRRYVLDSLIETTIARDVLLMTRVDKPALLRRLFELACSYSGQVLSYTKLLGQLQDAGNTTTLAHYLDLLSGAGLVLGLQKYAGDKARSRGSSPKLQVLNTALLAVQSDLALEDYRQDGALWGRLVGSAVGAHLANAALMGEVEVFYWRERNREVDFVVKAGRRLTAIEVKSGGTPSSLPGMKAFVDTFGASRTLLVGGDSIGLAEFLEVPVRHWIDDRTPT